MVESVDVEIVEVVEVETVVCVKSEDEDCDCNGDEDEDEEESVELGVPVVAVDPVLVIVITILVVMEELVAACEEVKGVVVTIELVEATAVVVIGSTVLDDAVVVGEELNGPNRLCTPDPMDLNSSAIADRKYLSRGWQWQLGEDSSLWIDDRCVKTRFIEAV